jgi:hypothetical protein
MDLWISFFLPKGAVGFFRTDKWYRSKGISGDVVVLVEKTDRKISAANKNKNNTLLLSTEKDLWDGNYSVATGVNTQLATFRGPISL